MIDLNIELARWWDAILIGVLVAGGYVATVLTLTIVRSLATAGAGGLVYGTKLAHGWRRYKNNHHDIINVTLNTLRSQERCGAPHLSIDTIVGDRPLTEAWPNLYQVHRLRAMAKRTTLSDPVVKFDGEVDGVDEYRQAYDPLISMVAERITNTNSIDLSLGRRMAEHRYVLALTYERHCDIRSRHFRVMMVNEEELKDWGRMTEDDWARAVASSGHKSRLWTLRQIAFQYKLYPDRFGVMNVWRPA